MDYKLKILTNQDLPAITTLCQEASDYMTLATGQSNPAKEAQDLLTSLPPQKKVEDKTLYGIFNNQNRLIGVLDLVKDHPTPKAWMIGLLLLTPKMRDQEIGKHVHDQIMAQIKAAGGTEIRLGILKNNPRAQKFWQRQGYTFQEEKIGTVAGVLMPVYAFKRKL
ncbi:GNAT family N-acetyltransferase [Enterococcus montenegrensis]|uniref:GNAT family N-acetyltransferase n=1 Tax=Enterococcus montenegrensis TaxID=3031993 RepID=UPI00249F6A55|nr:GNAT family N-acetyltransferase [Enterococcus montenegrensis]WHA09445.1 GNAT family N-acetyltransferase [Enterococcus montenegrensis]